MNILWFRNDLRLDDNAALHNAMNEGEPLLPVYIFDPRQFGTTESGNPKTGSFRLRFLLESLRALKESLKAKGSDLVILHGKPEELIPQLCKNFRINRLYYHREATWEETSVEHSLNSSLDVMGVEVVSCWGSTLFHLEDLPMNIEQLPDVFTAFRKKVEKSMRVRAPFPLPDTLPGLPEDAPASEKLPDETYFGLPVVVPSERSVLPFEGGETAGLRRVHYYLWETNLLKKYKQTRNGMLGEDYSSKFSPWLANGSISARRIYEQIKQYEAERGSNESTYWLVFELIWRDYFRFVALKAGPKLFFSTGLKEKRHEWSRDPTAFNTWARAETGIPLIDANMRELNETGFMSNRGRQNVASFLTKYLNIDWRLGAEYFESLLLDYDVCSNWGNWAYNAGVGNDARDRYFNIVGQGKRYDAGGDYIRHWLPELTEVPTEYIHEPHRLSVEQQQQAGIQIGHDYPYPMVDLDAVYRGRF